MNTAQTTIDYSKFLTAVEQHELKFLSSKFVGNDFYLVGGSVRDMVLGLQPKDYDFATNVQPDKIKELFVNEPTVQLIEVGEPFGVIKVMFVDSKNQYEVAAYREDVYEGGYHGGGGADSVKFSTIEKDVERRDLTINALFLDIHTGSVVDLVGGLEDIQNNVVKAVGNPALRLQEDNLRAFRAIRFAARFENGTIEPNTSKAIKQLSFYGVSPERIREEFLKGIKTCVSVKKYLSLLDEHELLKSVLRQEINWNVEKFPKTATKYVPFILAWLLNNSSDTVTSSESVMRRMCYTVTEMKETQWFLTLLQHKISFIPTVQNAFRLKKQQNALKISKQQLQEWIYTWCDKSQHRKLVSFLNYDLSVSPVSLMKEGFSGAGLGAEIEKRELEIYKQLVREYKT